MLSTRIKKYELGLLYRRGDFLRLLEPGTYRLPGVWFGIDQLEIVNVLDTRFRNKLLDLLIRVPEVSDRLEVVELDDEQRAVVWRNGRVFDIVGAGLYAYWRQPHKLAVEVYSTRELRLETPRLDAILAHGDAQQHVRAVDVDSHERLLLRRGGKIIDELGPGRWAFWQIANSVSWAAVDMREQVTDVQGQDIMTADKVTLRLNLVVSWRIVDAERSVTVVADAESAIYRQSQLALRAAIGGRTLDKLLAAKDAVGDEVRRSVTERAAEFGVEIKSMGIRDVILPGEMKAILNQVIEAEKRAQANLIHRREETAAARSRANTARLLADNPVLLELEKLEALAGVLAGTKATFVLGQGELTEQVRSLVAKASDE